MERHNSFRGWFAHELHKHMRTDQDIWVVTGDLGYGMLDQIRQDYPNRFLNAGAAEQAMMGIAVGLAQEDKKPFVYSITPFLLYRPFETIRNYIHHEKAAVRLIGSGREMDYEHDGFSHWCFEDMVLMRSILYNIEPRWPNTKEEIPGIVEQMVKQNRPWYINLRR